MQYLKQSTASQSVLIGPFVDATDGVTAETGLTIANTDIRLSKNGANIAAKNSGGGTHDELGYYTITLDATDTDTVGRLQLMATVTGALPVYHEYQVLEEAIYDALFAASAAGFDSNARVNVATFAGTITTLDALDTAQDSQHAATQALVTTVDTVVDGIQTDLSNATDGLGAIKADTAAILTDTGTTIPGTITALQATADAIEADTQDLQTRIPAALVGGRIDANIGAISASQAAADQLELNVEASLAGTASGTPTTTSMVSDIAVTVDDQFKGRIIIFQSDTTTAALRNQATDITACTAASNTLTFTALTTAPSSGDTFIIV